MAYTTESSYTGNGSTTEFLVTFPFLESTDIKARVNGVDTSAFTITGNTVTFTTAPPNTQVVLLYRDTDIDKTKVVFHAGSSIRAQDLNNTSKQLLYAIQEEEQSTGGVAFDTGNKGQITVSSANNWVINNGVVTEPMMAANSVDSDQYVDGSIDNIHLANLSVSTGKIQDDAVTTDKLSNSLDAAIVANTAKVTNATHTGEVTGATALTIADNIVDEANLKVDNTPTNDDVLTAKSSAAGGLTWASMVEAAPAGWQIGFGHASTTTKKDFTENNTWDDSGLAITYTPKSSSSLLLIEARPIIRCRPADSTYSAYFELRYELDNSGSDLDGAVGVQYGVSAQHADYSYYVAQANQPILLTAVYTNSNTNQKIFKVQGRAPSSSAAFTMNDDTSTYGLSTGKSYITIKEIAN